MQKLADGFHDQGLEVRVITPQPSAILHLIKGTKPSLAQEDCRGILVHRPPVTTFSKRRLPFIGSTFPWSVQSWKGSALRELSRIERQGFRPDFCYAHFLYPAGAGALEVGRRLSIPTFVGIGEANNSLLDYSWLIGVEQVSRDLNEFRGTISVSAQNEDSCRSTFGMKTNCLVAPNGVNLDLFLNLDKTTTRRSLGLNQSDFIVAFVGSFIHRKGPSRALEAIRNARCKGVFLGKGAEWPEGPEVVFAGPVEHAKIPQWLSACDAFLLPTLSEGCCNALLEAAACGLPIISSNLPFNTEILNEDEAILVDPMKIPEMTQALLKLKNDPDYCQRLCHASRSVAERHGVLDRTRRILDWIQSRIETSTRMSK